MKKLHLARLTALAGTVVLSSLMLTPVTATAASPNYDCDNTPTTKYTVVDPSIHIRVGAGASCYLKNATVKSIQAHDAGTIRTYNTVVTHNIHSEGAENVYIIDTEVGHNINVMGTEQDTTIGSLGCAVDPHAGNNVQVKDSHNVAICWVSADNNIKVFGNDGGIMVRDSDAGNNIMVKNNDAYVALPTDNPHPNADLIRFRNNTADNHNMVNNNSGRPVWAVNNVPAIS